MNRPPRIAQQSLFSPRMVMLSLFQGASVLLVVFTIFAIALTRGQGELDARALAFTTLIVANIGLILANRSWTRPLLITLKTPNSALWWVIGIAIIGIGVVLYIPFLNQLFGFDALHIDDILICLGAGILSIVGFEILKAFAPTLRHHPLHIL